MKTKTVMTILPTIVGILSVLGILFISNLIFEKGSVMHSSDIKFYILFVPITTICALIVQYLLTLRLWDRFKKRERVFGMNLFQFTSLLTIISGLIFGFVFWERSYGIYELIWVTLTGIFAFAIYWTSNLIILIRLDRS
jgi:uncharacterized membrane protein YedE/YeeE